MKADNNVTNNMVKNHIRSLNVIDEKVLQIMQDIHRDIFVPEKFKDFSYIDFEMPIGNNQSMLLPSIEATIMQALNIKSNESVLIIGSGTGYLTTCISILCKKILSVDFFKDFVVSSQKNIEKTNIKKNITIKQKDITLDWKILKDFDVIIFTSYIEGIGNVLENMRENARTFVFLGSQKVPFKNGMIINKYKNSSYHKDFVIETTVKPLIMGGIFD